MPLNADQLPAHVRALLEDPGPKRTTRKAAAGDSTWECATCRERFTKWAPAERHANAVGHHRIALVLVST